jgi:hypothetical protein
MNNYCKSFIIRILFLVFFCNTLQAFSQISSDYLKYWYYRNRLNKYFVVPGYNYGESQIICIRNDVSWQADNFKTVDYGQHGKYTGLYIGVLATEYYLLNKNGQNEDAANTQDELYKALYAVKTYFDEKAENLLILKRY